MRTIDMEDMSVHLWRLQFAQCLDVLLPGVEHPLVERLVALIERAELRDDTIGWDHHLAAGRDDRRWLALVETAAGRARDLARLGAEVEMSGRAVAHGDGLALHPERAHAEHL